jgi:WD40 repeat protein
MHTKYQASTPHFQLRNHFAVQDHLRYIYSSGSQVWSEYNWSSSRIKIMDVSEQSTFVNPVTISTLALSTDHPRRIAMIGGLNGEFAYKSLLGDDDALNSREPSTGHITAAASGCINHIDMDYFSNRQSHHAIISCNDSKLRTLDLTTGLFLHNPSKPNPKDGTLTGHPFPFAINSSATCPDGRLRVLVGDSPSSLIVNASTGKIETTLTGHADYVFACAWSPDARHVVTAGQDRVVKIYDARTWRVVRTFSSHGSCHRSVRFSPVGGGTRCLLLAEEADRVTVVDARTFAEGQTHSFYGGVVGCDFERDGTAFWVANGDGAFGGFMRFERTGKGQRRGLGFAKRGRGGEEEGPDEWIAEEEREGDPRCVNPRRHGEIGGWMT